MKTLEKMRVAGFAAAILITFAATAACSENAPATEKPAICTETAPDFARLNYDALSRM